MTNPPANPDLKALFQELREKDEGRAPSFEQLMAGVREDAAGAGARPGPVAARHRRKRAFPRLAWGGSLLAAAAAGAALLLLPGRGTSDAEFVTAVRSYSTDPAGGAWRSPTDALLALPGSEVLSTLPSIGGRQWPVISGANPRSNQL